MKSALALTILLAFAINGLANDGSNRVWIVGLTNGSVLSGEVRFPIKFAVTNKYMIWNILASNNTNGPLSGALVLPDTNGDVFLDWNTDMSDNGDYAVVVTLVFSSSSVASVPLNVTVTNLFFFPNGHSQLFVPGSSMLIYTRTIPGAKVQIDMYGENTNYLGSFDTTSDTGGVVSFLWDLTDGNGHRFKDTSFGGVFSLEKMPAVSHPVSKPNLHITTMPLYMRLQKSDKRASENPTANGPYQVACQWHGRQQ